MYILRMSFQETVQKRIYYFLHFLLFTELTLHKQTEIYVTVTTCPLLQSSVIDVVQINKE